jgi:hypothetical protein
MYQVHRCHSSPHYENNSNVQTQITLKLHMFTLMIYIYLKIYLHETLTHNIRMFPMETESGIHSKFHFISCGHNTTIIHKVITIVINFITFSITFITNIACFFITLEEESCDKCFPCIHKVTWTERKPKNQCLFVRSSPKICTFS